MSRPCPSCPDGNEWGANGPTGRACRTCGGTAVINEEDDDDCPYCECEAEIHKLRDLLRDEFNRGNRLDSPWDCFEHDCPGFKQPMHKSCGCYQDATKAHISQVLKEINQS